MSGRKHNNIKSDSYRIGSFEPISLFFLSADAAFRQAQYATFRQARIGKLSESLCGTSPKERKAKYLSKFIQFVKTVCFRPDSKYLQSYLNWYAYVDKIRNKKTTKHIIFLSYLNKMLL